MYKDKEKQKQANRVASQRRRDKAKGMTNAGYDAQGMTESQQLDAHAKRTQSAERALRTRTRPRQPTELNPAQTTQSTNAQDAPGSTKSDEARQIHPAEQGMIDMGFTPCTKSDEVILTPAEQNMADAEYMRCAEPVKPIRSRVGGCKCAIPGDEDYIGCMPQPAQAQPVSAEVKA